MVVVETVPTPPTFSLHFGRISTDSPSPIFIGERMQIDRKSHSRRQRTNSESKQVELAETGRQRSTDDRQMLAKDLEITEYRRTAFHLHWTVTHRYHLD